MNRTERLYKIQSLLSGKRAVPMASFLKVLEVSRATFRRDLEYLRDRLGAPIVWDREAEGYRLESGKDGESPSALPGLWLNDREILALLSMLEMLSTLEPNSLIGQQIAPIRKRLRDLLESSCVDADELASRVKILPIATRPVDQEIFGAIADALQTRRRIDIAHLSKATNIRTERQVSPQQLVYYRDNWYLDAFCHHKDDLRSFSVDSIEAARVCEQPAVSLSRSALRQAFEETYGIFAGKHGKTAQLRFTPFRARWVARETWHPNQKSHFDANGHYVLEIPYGDERELILDILRQGADCEVLAPDSLRQEVAHRLARALENYQTR